MKLFVFLLSVFGYVLFHQTKNSTGQLVRIYPVEDSQDLRNGAMDQDDGSFSSQELNKIRNLAKNISHSKGHIIKDGESDPEFRRSYEQKVLLETKFKILQMWFKKHFNTSGDISVFHLRELEEMVHQFETSIDFMKLGGIEFLLPLINFKNPEVCMSALSVLTAALQSNPPVQKYANNLHLLDYLLNLLSEENINSYHNFIRVRNTALYTLSAYIRNNPTAQLLFYEQGGLAVLAGVLESNVDNLKSKMKILDLIDDLEHEIHPQVPHGSPKLLDQLKRAYVAGYSNSNLCGIIPGFLEFDDLDVLEKTVNAMLSLAKNVCFKLFKRPHVLKMIKSVIHRYDDTNSYSWWMENTDVVYRRRGLVYDFRDLFSVLTRKKKFQRAYKEL